MNNQGSIEAGRGMQDFQRKLNRFKDDVLDSSYNSILKHRNELLVLSKTALIVHKELMDQAQDFKLEKPDQDELLKMAKNCQEIWEVTDTLLDFARRLEDASTESETSKGLLALAIKENVISLKQKMEIIRQLSLGNSESILQTVLNKSGFKKFSTSIAIILATLGVFGGKDSSANKTTHDKSTATATEKPNEKSDKPKPSKARKKISKKVDKPTGHMHGMEGIGVGSGESDGDKKGGLHGEALHAPREAGEKSSADMKNLNKIGEGGLFASVEHKSSASSDQEPLWAIEMVTRHHDGEFRVVPHHVKNFDSAEKISKVTMNAIDVEKGAEIVLYTPLNSTIGTIETIPSVPVTINRDNQSIRFDGSAENLVVTYTVVKSVDNFAIPTDAMRPDGDSVYAFESEDLIAKLQNSDPSQYAKLFKQHFSNFTYIVSSDIQELLDKMPGSDMDKVGGIRVGDCDMLSQYAAGLLTDAGKPAGVINGVLETDNKLDANKPHAQLVYFDKKNQPVSFESTSSTKLQFVNLKLLPEDREKLENIISEYQDRPTELYGLFRYNLDNILKKDYYGDFKDNSTAIKKIGNLMDTLENQFNNFGTDTKNALEVLFIILSSISTTIGVAVGAISLSKRATRYSKRKQIEAVTELINDKIGAFGEGENDDINDKKTSNLDVPHDKSEFELNKDYAKVFPWEKFEGLAPDQQKLILLTLSTNELFLDTKGTMNFLAAWWNRIKAEESFQNLRKDGLSVENLIKELDHRFSTPKIKEGLEKELPEKVSAIIKNGIKLAKETFGGLEDRPGVKKVTSQVFFDKIGLQLSGGRGNGEKPSRRSRVGASGDFAGFTEYQPGMDAKMIDWHASARTDNFLVKEKEVEASKQKPEKSVYLIINVFDTADNEFSQELPRLVAFLSYVQRHPKEVGVAGIDFVSNGKVVDRFPAAVVVKLNQRQAGFDAIQVTIQKIERLRLDNFGKLSQVLSQRKVNGYKTQDMENMLNSYYGRPENCDRGDAIPLLVDFPYRANDTTERLHKVYQFTVDNIFDNYEQDKKSNESPVSDRDTIAMAA